MQDPIILTGRRSKKPKGWHLGMKKKEICSIKRLFSLDVVLHHAFKNNQRPYRCYRCDGWHLTKDKNK